MKIVSKTLEEIRVGDEASAERTLQPKDVRAWAAILGEAAAGEEKTSLAAALFSSLAATVLPGPGSRVRSCAVEMLGDAPVGAPISVHLIVREKRTPAVIIDGRCVTPAGEVFAKATLEVVPAAKAETVELPDHRLDALLEKCRGLKPTPTGVVHPCSAPAIGGA
jgi:phosphate acetyltransferase